MTDRLTDAADVRAELRRVVIEEAQALTRLADQIDDCWVKAVRLLAGCKGRIVVTGVGKSGHVGRKIAASLASLGSPALFVHAGEAAHGDLGMMVTGDVVIALSNSGETSELKAILPSLQAQALPLIVITSRPTSTLGRAATVCLETPVEREADYLGLAPTVSSTSALAAGDALAVAVARLKQFTTADFGRRHPGGALGRQTAAAVKESQR